MWISLLHLFDGLKTHNTSPTSANSHTYGVTDITFTVDMAYVPAVHFHKLNKYKENKNESLINCDTFKTTIVSTIVHLNTSNKDR